MTSVVFESGSKCTTINALALQDAFEHAGLEAVVMTAVEMNVFADQYTARGADAALKVGKVVIFGAGLGSPFFSTDTAAVLRAAEINADIILMAKNVDGVYSADPAKDPSAVRYDEITYEEVLDNAWLSQILPYIDVLVDGKFVKSLKNISLRFRGSSNQRVIDLNETRRLGKIVLYME